GGRGAAGFDGGVDAVVAAGDEEGFEGRGLGEGFAAGEGYAAAGFIEEDDVALDFAQDLWDAHLSSGKDTGFGGAGIDTGAAVVALVGWNDDVVGADGCTSFAEAAAVG